MEPAIDRGGTQISHQPEINSCHSVQPLRETTAATSFQLRQESYIIVSIESASRESALEEQRERTERKDEEARNRKRGAMDLLRPTPTCTRFQTTTEMACIKCSEQMKLVSIEPQDGAFNLVTYRCSGCAADESFL